MKRMLTVSAATALALAIAIPAFAGGAHCSGGAKATTAEAMGGCSDHAKSAAWAGAWLQRSASGEIVVSEVAKGSPSARSGLKTGDVVLAVNGYNLAAMCASKAECAVGKSVTYTVKRGSSTRYLKFKLEKMPANATARLASMQASFDPALAAVVIPTAN